MESIGIQADLVQQLLFQVNKLLIYIKLVLFTPAIVTKADVGVCGYEL